MFTITNGTISPVESSISKLPPKALRQPRWTEGVTLKFVYLYIDQPCLWNPMTPQNKDRVKRFIACKTISEGMGIPDFGPHEVPRKIKILRSTYQQEMNKIEKSILKGGEENQYTPAMMWFHVMHKAIKNIPQRRVSQLPESYTNEIAEQGISHIPAVSSSSEDLIKSEPESAEEEVKQLPTKIYRNQKRSQNENQVRIQRKRELVEKKILLDKRFKENLDDDEFSLFGRHVAAQLRKLEEDECVTAQEQIQTVLSQARLRTIQRMNYNEDDLQPYWDN